jgi:drug/metabolite transporter (DMT)-like permease
MGALFALLAALSWGGGDYSGGRGSRDLNHFQVVVLSAITGIIILGLLGYVAGDPFPNRSSIINSGMAGAFGAVGIAMLYQALALGATAIVAPIAAVVGAVTPVVINFILEGAPAGNQQVGFILALAGLWLVTGTGQRANLDSRKSVLLAIIAGFGFGGFFIFIDQVQPGSNYLTLLIARMASFLVALAALIFQRIPLADPRRNPIAILAGLLDTGGNVFFLLASQLARLDVVVILASLYPAVTVILSRTLSGEPVSRRQWLGVVVCVLAVVIILI